MILAVVGSRTFTNYQLLTQTLDNYQITEIVSGGAFGADTLEHNIKLTVLKPNWSIGRHAGLLRNSDIVNHADQVIAFWDGQSKGTLDSINKAVNKLLKVIL